MGKKRHAKNTIEKWQRHKYRINSRSSHREDHNRHTAGHGPPPREFLRPVRFLPLAAGLPHADSKRFCRKLGSDAFAGEFQIERCTGSNDFDSNHLPIWDLHALLAGMPFPCVLLRTWQEKPLLSVPFRPHQRRTRVVQRSAFEVAAD